MRTALALGVEAKVIHLGKGCFQGVGSVETSSPDLSAMIGLLLFALSEANALSFAKLINPPFRFGKERVRVIQIKLTSPRRCSTESCACHVFVWSGLDIFSHGYAW